MDINTTTPVFLDRTAGAFNQAANASNSTQSFGAWVSDSISGVANKIQNVTSESWTGFTGSVESLGNQAKDFGSGIQSTITDKFNSVSGSVTSTINDYTASVTSTLNDYTANGTVLGDGYATASKAVIENSFGIRATGAAIGGAVAINSTINLLQGRQNIQPTREFVKIVAGTGLVALSLYASAEDELASLGNVALGTGLATALVKVATYAKETIHVHVPVYLLKNREASPDLKNVVQISTNS